MHWSQFGWFMNDWWSALYIMTRRHHILGISWTNIRVSNFKILQPLSSWHRGTSCLWVQVMPFLHLGLLLRGQVKLLTLEKNLGPATRPGDEPVPGKNKEEGRKLGYRWSWTKAQLSTPPSPKLLFSRGGEVSRTRVRGGSSAKVALSSKYVTWNNNNLDFKYSRCTQKSKRKSSGPEKNEAQFMTKRLLKAN